MSNVRARILALRRRLQVRSYSAQGVTLGDNVTIAHGTRLTRRTTIDSNVWINGPATVRGNGTVLIGSWTAIGDELLISTGNHDTNYPNMVMKLHWQLSLPELERPADVTIGGGCWIGDRVTILGGATIGPGCVLAAGAVVPRGDYPAYSIIGGNPAKIIKTRTTDDVVDVLVKSGWWTWDADRMRRNKAFLGSPISDTSAAQIAAVIVD